MISLPVVVIVHGSQDINALATVIWDCAFSERVRSRSLTNSVTSISSPRYDGYSGSKTFTYCFVQDFDIRSHMLPCCGCVVTVGPPGRLLCFISSRVKKGWWWRMQTRLQSRRLLLTSTCEKHFLLWPVTYSPAEAGCVCVYTISVWMLVLYMTTIINM